MKKTIYFILACLCFSCNGNKVDTTDGCDTLKTDTVGVLVNDSTIIPSVTEKPQETPEMPEIREDTFMCKVTTYHPVEAECNSNPLLTADGTIIDLDRLNKGEIKYCAVSRDLLAELPYGSIIDVEGYGEYEVHDTMNRRHKRLVDLLIKVDERGFMKRGLIITVKKRAEKKRK